MHKSQSRLIRFTEVLRKTGYRKSWIYLLISKDLFPKPIKLGVRSVAFIEEEVDQWIANKISESRKF
ncbi:AlpA family transcriptional regulator [Pantoea sp. SS70]|uniref:helix-turn-helix transcriptional regulator n=1 Tax=Pantoea sp. SS70 TaxID=3024247 RepID=UPI0024530A00|nr:AlpA family transcriptional regulator [Pantoea sp. SS70]WGK57178.1 AlpA family transcriptional regulator [Pantoea sp. SS70]